MNVTIDGVEYAPITGQIDTLGRPVPPAYSVGIGITTRNRQKVLNASIDQQVKFLPPGAKLVVVDDASDEPVSGAAYRFADNVGIARAKNKCLELLDDCEHIFLFDDDAYPIADGWWLPYVTSPEPHLMYQFLDLSGPRKLNDVTEIYTDAEHFALSGPRGVMLYVERWLLDVVGGFDTVYDRFGYEHGDWSNRIHHSGATSWRYADVQGSSDLIYSLDEHEAVERSLTRQERAEFVKRNAVIHNSRRDEWHEGYVEYREMRNVVLTSLFLSGKDPQRPAGVIDMAGVAKLTKSLSQEDVVMFTEDDTDWRLDDIFVRGGLIVEHPLKVNVYFERWLAAYQYLRDHREIRAAFIVDATDVEMLRSPWSEMTEGKLYIGYEPKVVEDEWMVKHHVSKLSARFIKDHPWETLLNAGVVGGDRKTLMRFAHRVMAAYFDQELRIFYGKDTDRDLADMAVVNQVAYEDDFEIVTGPKVVTKFKADERNTWSWFKHK
jgi:glycosyltransferase involved in cell wall biosynthesis